MEVLENKKTEIYTNPGHVLTIKTAYIVKMHERLSLRLGSSEEINLDIDIVADFKNIPEEHHNTFIHLMSARYGGVVKAIGDEKPFDVPSTIIPKWWEVWKRFL